MERYIIMDKYNKETKCPKCGSDLVLTEHNIISDTMIRRCSNCSFTFFQEPLDKKVS